VSHVSLDGLVAVVTGGGRGIGRAHCIELARRGASVVVNDVSAQDADQVVEEIASMPGLAFASHASIDTSEGAAAAVDAALSRFGTVDIVINNAGYTRIGGIEEQTDAMLDEVLGVHLRGAYFVTRAAWPIMQRAGFGRVIMTSSTAGLFGMKFNANYGAAKAGLYGLTRSLAYDGRPFGITVNAILPLALTTIHERDPRGPIVDRVVPEALEARLAPRRVPEAVAPLVAYLCSRRCALSGEAFTVGCGRFARVFVGETAGWVAPDASGVTAEAIEAHLDEIRDATGFSIPADHYDWLAITDRAITGAP
jgi:NAD(P)-dependent dehydrogenase (short-subunit alcohol dehydrogenase family)